MNQQIASTKQILCLITLSSTFHLLPTYSYASNQTLIKEDRLPHSIGAHCNRLYAQHIDIFLHSSNTMTDKMQDNEASKKSPHPDTRYCKLSIHQPTLYVFLFLTIIYYH